MDALSAVYGAAATWRRRWYAATPTRARRLTQPVVSVGNLRVGGTGKTPIVACIARLLLARGERPVILSRGYARQTPSSRVTVVADRERVLTDVAHAGDEPLLLARALPGVPVLVCADRFRAGRHAEAQFAPTVHLLDDGFQHVQLFRDIDLLLLDEQDLDDRVLPAGRLREPLANACGADAVLMPGGNRERARKTAERLGVANAFAIARSLGAPHGVGQSDFAGVATGTPVFAFAGIARPERFFADLRAAGFTIAGTREFRDHHVFGPADVERLVEAARAAGAGVLMTTEKDGVRLESLHLSEMPLLAVPLHATIEPTAEFTAWIEARLATARTAGDA